MATGKKMNIVKKIMMGLLVALVAIQFIHPAKNINPEMSAQHIAKTYQVPDSVQHILEKACYDCHSNNTKYPWYNNIQPVAWWLNNHVQEGKEELNFSEFGTYPLKRQSGKLKKAAHEVEDGGMPMSSYTWIHKDAILTPAEKELFMAWANSLSREIAAKLPPEERK